MNGFGNGFPQHGDDVPICIIVHLCELNSNTHETYTDLISLTHSSNINMKDLFEMLQRRIRENSWIVSLRIGNTWPNGDIIRPG
jgi:hypothetical protein